MDRKAARLRGFTLVELLIVVGIIAILVGLLLPAMFGVRTQAQRVETENLMREVRTALESFQASQQRAPGYFSMVEMSGPENSGSGGEGFTEMENILLDLAGGVIPDAEYDADPSSFQMDPTNAYVDVGPLQNMDSKVHVDLNRVGSDDPNVNPAGAYLTLPLNQMFPVQGQRQADINNKLWTTAPSGLDITHKGMADVVDPFGQPIMAWRLDPSSPMRPTSNALSASPGSTNYLDYWASYDQTSKTGRPGFYWSTNSGYLAAGEGGIGLGNGPLGPIDQSAQSMIGFQTMNALGNQEEVTQQHLAGLLGSPAFPLERGTVSDPWRPAKPRGSIVLQSAGPNQVYLENPVSGDGKSIQSVRDSTTQLDLARTLVYAPTDGDPISYTGSSGSVGRSINEFDDIITATGN
ncbi:MAG: type II secretion system protein [Phycisphaerales bacterium JB043]